MSQHSATTIGFLWNIELFYTATCHPYVIMEACADLQTISDGIESTVIIKCVPSSELSCSYLVYLSNFHNTLSSVFILLKAQKLVVEKQKSIFFLVGQVFWSFTSDPVCLFWKCTSLFFNFFN